MDVAAELGGGGTRGQRRRLQVALSCSAMTRTAHRQITLASFLSLSTSSATRADLDAGRALGRLGDLERLQARRDVDAEIASGFSVSSGFFLAFMMLGSERSAAR